MKSLKVNNKIVPNGYSGICLWPFGIYVSDEAHANNKRTIRHENTHWEQQKELLGIFFYVLYAVEWILKFFRYGTKSYRNLAAEREAYTFQDDKSYLVYRTRYNWLKYIFQNP